jgi:hypothetical protein
MQRSKCIDYVETSWKPKGLRVVPRIPLLFNILLLAFALVSCSNEPSFSDSLESPSEPESDLDQPWFEETASHSVLTFRHHSGSYGKFYIPEMMTGGVGLLDYDKDGHLDVYCVQGGSLNPDIEHPPGNQLYRNRGDGTFENATETAGVGDNGYGMGVACADYDRDGDTDIYVTNLEANVLYRNNGDGTFTDVTAETGVGDPSWGTSAAFFDYDNDGHLDLVIANYLNWSRGREVECYSRGGKRDDCSPMND